MKLFVTFLYFLIIGNLHTSPSFLHAEIRVDGLTCSLCSRSVEMALKKLDFVQEVDMNLETTLAEVKFKKGAPVNVNEIAKAVKKAGFSIGMLRISAQMNGYALDECKSFEYNGQVFQFYGTQEDIKVLPNATFIIDGKDFLTNEDFSKIKSLLPEKCAQEKLNHFYARF